MSRLHRVIVYETARYDPDAITTQEIVTLAALDSMGASTAKDVGEALTYAQEWLPPPDRIDVPINGYTAGQYLGLLRTRGLVECDPPAGEPCFGRRRRWTINQKGYSNL